MRRSLLVGAAWIVATAVSMLVAYAAVGEVRDRVVDQPQPLSVVLSTSTSVPVPGDGTPSTTTPGSTSTTPVGPVTTSTTATPITDATSGSTTSSTPTSGTSPSTTAAPAGGEIKTYSTAGGTVSIEVFPDHLVLLGAVPATGYSVAEQEISATQMEIEFKSGEHEIHFKARLNSDGSVTVDVESGEEHHED